MISAAITRIYDHSIQFEKILLSFTLYRIIFKTKNIAIIIRNTTIVIIASDATSLHLFQKSLPTIQFQSNQCSLPETKQSIVDISFQIFPPLTLVFQKIALSTQYLYPRSIIKCLAHINSNNLQ